MGEKDICKIMILGQNGLDDPKKSKFYENGKKSEKSRKLMKTDENGKIYFFLGSSSPFWPNIMILHMSFSPMNIKKSWLLDPKDPRLW